MTWRAALLSSTAIRRRSTHRRLVQGARLLALASEMAFAQITNPGLGQFKFSAQPKLDLAHALEGVAMALLGLTHLLAHLNAQRLLRLRRLIQCDPQALIGPLQASKGSLMRVLPIVALGDEFDMLALGQCDALQVPGHDCASDARRGGKTLATRASDQWCGV